MTRRLAARVRSFLDPQARKARRTRRRRAWDTALDEADRRAGRHGPAPTRIYRRSMRPDHRDYE